MQNSLSHLEVMNRTRFALLALVIAVAVCGTSCATFRPRDYDASYTNQTRPEPGDYPLARCVADFVNLFIPQ
jgi:hypothetical protein